MKKRIFLFFIISIFFNLNLFSVYQGNPSYSYKARGDFYRRKGVNYFAYALQEYENAINERKNYAECYYWIAWIFNQKKLYDQAIMEINVAIKYKDALQYKSRFIDMLYLKSEIFFKNDMNNEGKKVLEEIIDYLKRYRRRISDLTEPVYRKKFGRAYFLLGAYYRRSNLLNTRNIKNFIRAIRLGFKPDLCHYFLYEYYNSRGRKANAASHLESAKRILKQNGKTIEDLKNTLSHLNWEKMWLIN